MTTEAMNLGQESRMLEMEMLKVLPLPEQAPGHSMEMTDEELLTEIQAIMGSEPEGTPVEPMLEVVKADEIDIDAMRFEMGMELLDQGYYFQAREIYSQLAKQGYNEYESLIRLGMAQKFLGDSVNAAASLNKALMIKTETSDAWYHLGLLLMESDKPMLNEARAFLRQAYRLNPECDDISTTLQRCEMMIKGYMA